jgi:hypothetical protein
MGNSSTKKDAGIDPRHLAPPGPPKPGWDPKLLKKLVLEKKLAPFYPGTEEKVTQNGEITEECPICFLVPIHFFFSPLPRFSLIQLSSSGLRRNLPMTRRFFIPLFL